MAETASRTALENALYLYAPVNRQEGAKDFLEGLATTELLFLAEFLGSCILITSAADIKTWDAISHRAKVWQRKLRYVNSPQREDLEHKLIVVKEFAARCGFTA